MTTTSQSFNGGATATWVQTDDGDGNLIPIPRPPSELAKVALRPGQCLPFTSGSATCSYVNWGFPLGNEDGTEGAWALTTPAGAVGNGCALTFNFSGRIFGVRWYRQRSSMPAFTVIVDGVAYNVNSVNSANNNLAFTGTMSDQQCAYIVVDDLPEYYLDGTPMIHTGTIQLPASAAGGTLYFFGLLLEKRLGHTELPRILLPAPSPSKVGASMAAPTISGQPSDQTFRGCRKIVYYNTDSVARVVTIQMLAYSQGSYTVIKKLYLGAAGVAPSAAAPTGDSAEFDLGGNFFLGTNIQHMADAAGVVNYMIVGAY